MTTRQPTLCIGILTKNEERRITQCIESAAFADYVVVVDSGSTDKTVDLATASGAAVYVYADWLGFAEQRNRLLAHCDADYIFFLDADELVSPELQQEIVTAVAAGLPNVWETHWLEVAFGRPLKRLRSRKSLPRFFRRDTIVNFEGVVHEHANLVDGNVARSRFANPLLHFSRETIHDSLKKLTQYAMLGAAKRAKRGKRGGVTRGLLSAGWMFFRLYFLKLACLEGAPGFLYSFFIALEFFFRQAALRYDRALLRDDVQR
jgi:glycosyltransferase involved in cell wall biosynthesis